MSWNTNHNPFSWTVYNLQLYYNLQNYRTHVLQNQHFYTPKENVFFTCDSSVLPSTISLQSFLFKIDLSKITQQIIAIKWQFNVKNSFVIVQLKVTSHFNLTELSFLFALNFIKVRTWKWKPIQFDELKLCKPKYQWKLDEMEARTRVLHISNRIGRKTRAS